MTEEELEAEIQRLMANQTLADRELDRAIDKLYARFEREQEDDCEEEDELWERHFGRNSLAKPDDEDEADNFRASVPFEDYNELDPNDFDPEEVDGGPDGEDEYFETGEDPEDEEEDGY